MTESEAQTGPMPSALRTLVQRPVLKDGLPVKKKGTEEVQMRPLAAKEVLAWRETEAEVRVVTVDGSKFSARKDSKGKPAAAGEGA